MRYKRTGRSWNENMSYKYYTKYKSSTANLEFWQQESERRSKWCFLWSSLVVLMLLGRANPTWSGQHPADAKSGNKSGYKGQSHLAGQPLQPTEPTLILNNKEIFQKNWYAYSQTVQKILFGNGTQLQYREHHRHDNPSPNPNPGTRAQTLTVLHLQCLDCLTYKGPPQEKSALHITPACDDWCVS